MVKVKVAVAKFRKAVVAALAVGAVALLKKIGVDIDNDTVAVLIDAAIVAGVVWAVPNAKPILEDEAV